MYVALNIGNNSLKILSMKGRQVKKWGNRTLEAGLVRDGLIQQPQSLGEAIDELFKSTKIPRENVITCLAGLSFTYRFLSLPHMKPASLEEAILRAARKEISLSLDELYLSWQPLPSQGDEQAFFILGVPRNLVDALIQTLNVASVEPYLMDLRPLAVARAANRGDAIVVNLEPDCFDIVFIANGIPAVIHTISPRSEGATLEDNILRLADELTKTAAFCQSSHPESPLSLATPLLLTGDLATAAPASGLLQVEIEYPVEPLTPPVDFPPELPLASYAANIGLAMKKMPQKSAAKGEEARFYDININILSGKYRKSRAQPLPARYILLGMFLVIAVLFLFPLYQARSQISTENAALKTEMRALNREVNMASLSADEASQNEDTIQEIIASTEALKMGHQKILSARGSFNTDLQLVTEALPPQTFFTSIEINNDLITVQGETNSVFTAVSYATALEARGTFPEVRIIRLDEARSITSESKESEMTSVEVSTITYEILMNK